MSTAFLLVLALIAQTESIAVRPQRRVVTDAVERRLDAHLSALYRSARAGGSKAFLSAAKDRRLDVGPDGRVEIEAHAARGSSLDAAAVSGAGFDVVGVSDSTVTLRASPAEFASLCARFPVIASLRASPPAFEETSQGVAATHANVAHVRGATGAGTRLAIIDTGFDSYSSLVGMGLVPAPVATRNFTQTPLESTSVHGTAVAQTAHDMAPDAQILLIKIANLSQFEKGVEFAADHGADVLNASLGFLGANFSDGTGDAAHAMTDAVKRGVLPVVAAGNHGDAHWLGKWRDKNKNTVHEFAPDDEGLTFSVDQGTTAVAYLVWDDFPDSSVDLDLFIYYVGTNANPLPPEDFIEIDSSETVQDGDQAPVEALSFTAPATGNYAVVVPIFSSKKPSRFAVFLTEKVVDGNNVAKSSIVTPADAKDAVAVGAVYIGDWGMPLAEEYSSRGPTTAGRTKPDISGPDGTDSSLYFPGFFGTSAASPHVAGGACLIKSIQRHATVKQLRKRLLGAADPLGDENTFGAGGLELGNDFFPPGMPTVPFDVPSIVVDVNAVSLFSTLPVDLTPPVLYRFRALGKHAPGASSSPWQVSPQFVDDGLAPDRSYKWKLSTRDSADPVNTTPNDSTIELRTLAAVLPAPTLRKAKSTSLKLRVGGGSNPKSTEVALLDVTSNLYLAPDGVTTSATPIWAKASAFGSVKVSGLVPATSYEFRARARNADLVETALSDPLIVATTP